MSRSQVAAAITALVEAGNRLTEAQPTVVWRLKNDGTFLTILDVEIQGSLEAPLLSAFPGSVFIGEEDAGAADAARTSRPRLFLDPIDGTAPYARGLNFFAISLALVDSEGAPCVAIVYMPARRRFYAGAREVSGWVRYAVSIDGGSVLVEPLEELLIEEESWKLEDSYVYVGSGAHRELDMSEFEGKLRALGATATHLALLLDRTPDPAAVVLTRYKIWDAVAGLALAEAAGFEVRDLRNLADSLTVRDVVKAEKPPPLVVGSRQMVGALTRTIRLLGES